MFSKSFRAFHFVFAILFSVSAILTQTGCDNFLRDKRATPEVLELKDSRFECLKAVPSDLKAFSTGDAEVKRIKASVNCVQTALIYFSKRTKGSSSEGYTAEDLRSFFGKYLLKENNVSHELAQNLYKLKSGFFGGSQEVMTREELNKVVNVLTVFKAESVALAPYMKVLVFQAKGKVKIDDVSAATEQLRRSLQTLLRVVEISHSDYTFEDLRDLMGGLSQFVQGSGQVGLYADIRKWMPIVEATKNVFVGEKPTITGLNDWIDVVDNIVDLYGITARSYYFGKAMNLSLPSDVRRATIIGNQMIALVENSYQMKRTGAIPLSAIDNLIDQLVDMKILTVVSKKAIKDTYKIMLSGMFDPVRRGETRGLVDFNRDHIASIRREFSIFQMGQIFVDSLPFDEKGWTTRQQILEAYEKFDLQKSISQVFRVENIEATALKSAWKDMGLILNQPRLVQFDTENRVLIQSRGDLYPYSWKSMTWWNLTRTFARLFQLGYGNRDSLNVAQSEISEAMLSKWYDDFNTLGVEIKAFDPMGKNGGKRSFKEANFFMYSSDGIQGVSFLESFEFISFLFSAGFKNVSEIREAAEKSDCAVNEVDVFGNKLLKETCFRDAMKRNFEYAFGNLPGMVADVRKMNSKKWEEFFSYLISASRSSDPRGGMIDTGDIRTMVMIMHYVESLMIVFDINQNGTLDVDEIKAAAPRFRDFIRPMIPSYLAYDSFIDDAFANLVINGKIPKFWDVTKFQAQKFYADEATRLSLFKVFNNLKDALKTSSK